MDQYLCISTVFLGNRYHGKEWPPSPARLFQALLAGVQTGSYRQHWPTVESVLHSLERLPAPEVLASDFRQLPPYRIAVPNNDSDKAAREWSAGRAFDAATLRNLKTVSPREILRQNEKPHLYYLWKIFDESISIQAVRQLAFCLHTFGWGIDMAYADSFLLNESQKRALSAQGYSHHVPASTGQLRDVPAPGYLLNLIEAYQHYCNRLSGDGIDPSTRAIKYGQERYQCVGSIDLPAAKFVMRKLDNSNAYYSVPWSLSMKVAAWMRHAAAEALREENIPEDVINSYVLGHGNGHGKHMSFVPVPNIGTIYPDGAVRRVMVLEPPNGPDFAGIRAGEITEILQVKLSSFVLRRLVENGNGPRKTEPVCSILQAEEDKIWPYYTRQSSLWHSVTPVVLHGHNSEHGKFSQKKTEQLLYQAFEKSGYARHSITDLFFQPAPLWAGTEGALQMRVPEHLKKWPRYHVGVRFHDAVTGPVLAGIGRHYGIGLFAAQREEKNACAAPI